MTPHTMPSGISVVLCCHNSARVIEPTIRALDQQRLPEGQSFEVVLVDNHCTDDSVSVARSCWSGTHGELRVVEEPIPGLVYARRTGVLSARYDKLLFVDDDNILDPDWLERLTACFDAHPTVGAMGGYSEPQMPTSAYPDWFDEYQTVYACGPQAPQPGILPPRRKKFLYGAGLAFRTQVARHVLDNGPPMYLVGRTENLLLRGDDTEMCLRAVLLGWDLYYEPALRLRHNLLPERIRWGHVLQMREGTGASIPILHIYTRVADGEPPWSYPELVKHVTKEWMRFLARPWALRNLHREGHPTSFQYAFLRGLHRSAIRLRSRYSEIRSTILEHYGRPGQGRQEEPIS